MNKQPLVSVIMNCYNGEKYLKEAIDSVYAQTYKTWEIIFWDNTSTDNSAKIAKRYDSKLHYFEGEKNIPLGAARNKAVEQTKGEFIAFLDCDDIWMPEKLEKQIIEMVKDDFALGYSGVISIDSYGKRIGKYVPKYKSGFLFKELLNQFDINLPTAIINKMTMERLNLKFDPQIVASEEYCLFMQLIVKSKVLVIPEIFAKYRILGNSLTNKSISKWAYEREYTLNKVIDKYPNIQNEYEKEFKEAYARANYYRARYFTSIGKIKEARSHMRKIALNNPRYFILFILLFFSIYFLG